MSGTNPLFRVEDVVGDDILGDRETQQTNQALSDVRAALDDADERVDDVAADARQIVDDADERVDDIAADVRQAADDADEGVDDIGDDDGASGGGTQGGSTQDGAAAAAETVAALVLPANNSGVLGFALATLTGNVLDVRVIAANLTPGQVHPLHIHGFADGRTERLPTVADDADGDGVGETPEGEAAAFGPVIAGLTASGEAQAGLEVSPDFPAANTNGRLVFSQSYVLDQAEADDASILTLLQERLEGRVIELHGVNVPQGLGAGTPNEANGTAGYNPQVPVAAGQLLALPGVAEALGALGEDAPAELASGITAFLDALAPYTLNAAGTGPLAPDPLAVTAGGSAGSGTATGGTGTAGGTGTGSSTTSGTTTGTGSGTQVVQQSSTTSGGEGGTVTQSNQATTSGGSATVNQSNVVTQGTGGGTATQTDLVTQPGGEDGTSFAALLLPTNNSGVFGAAAITFDEDAGTLSIDLDLAGLEPGQVHAIHIHGFTDDRASIVPNLQVDADRDGFLEEPEASPFLGPVRLGITEDGSITDAALAGNYPVADADGRISLEQTYRFDLDDPAAAAVFRELEDRLEGRALQVHGLTTPATVGEGTRGEVDGTAGYQPLLAVANGAILSAEDAGGAFGAALGGLVQAGLDGEAPDLAALQAALAQAASASAGGSDTLIG